MSYRTYINDVQIFGNNEYYEKWINFIKSQNIHVDDEGCYNGENTDFMGALSVIEEIVLDMEQFRIENRKKLEKEMDEKKLTPDERNIMYNTAYGVKSLFDLKYIYDNYLKQDNGYKYNMSLFDYIDDTIQTGYLFMPYLFFNSCKDKIESTKHFSTPNHFLCYKIKDGEHIYVHAG